MQKVNFTHKDISYTFFVGNPSDAMQKKHLAGELFDYPELQKMAEVISDGDTIADIGTNVGNHAVFFSKNFPKSKITVFEP